MTNSVLISKDSPGIATITMNKPDVHNAFDESLIADLTKAVKQLNADSDVRVVILAANGKSFSAGADLGWMQKMSGYSEEENLRDARLLAELMSSLDQMTKPTIARVQGSAFGGGVGLIACCDIAVSVYDAKFALSEARLGLIPAVISPYVVSAIGARNARRYFLTGERFDAERALDMGLAHQLCYADELDSAVEEIVDALLECGPGAQTACKYLIRQVQSGKNNSELIEWTAQQIAKIRASHEGKEGISAFLEKRAPKWLKKRA
ncbi:MAG: enoyl-CoA hydratase/isomerase family protein [Alphaproteobacteria bacterium]|nr:MAG: enoyl-CoA hydratase/isomerase family protein [Alphaproteobacteria bacterium]